MKKKVFACFFQQVNVCAKGATARSITSHGMHDSHTRLPQSNSDSINAHRDFHPPQALFHNCPWCYKWRCRQAIAGGNATPASKREFALGPQISVTSTAAVSLVEHEEISRSRGRGHVFDVGNINEKTGEGKGARTSVVRWLVEPWTVVIQVTFVAKTFLNNDRRGIPATC